MPWYSLTDEFDADFGVDEWHGTNAFIRDGNRVFRTYFVNNRGDEALGSTWSYLDLTALGRQEEWEDSPEGYPQTPPYQWWNWHDEYETPSRRRNSGGQLPERREDSVQLPPMPDSAACRAALDIAGEYCSPALLNHSVRSYLWAASFAAAREIVFDDELLYVSAVLHDLGLLTEFDNHRLPFEFAGGHVAAMFAAGAGWPRPRRRRVVEVIVAHMADSVDVRLDPEGFLLERSTGFDISGRGPEDFPEEVQAAVMARYPRLGLAEEFLACFRDQADRKPTSQAAAAVRSGIDQRLAANPLEHR